MDKLTQLLTLKKNRSTQKQTVTQKFRKPVDKNVNLLRELQRKTDAERVKLIEVNEDLKTTAHKKKVELEELENELCILLQEIQIKDEEKKLVSECLTSSISDKEYMKQKIESVEQQSHGKLSDLQKTDRLFQERLGLKFKSTTDQELEIIFTNIDPKDTSLHYCFTLKFVEGKYKVSNAQPEIEDLNILTQRLNKTNSFRSFIIAVRKYYKHGHSEKS
ncbi:hypothetical protein LOTGIDRAFT_237170 [Lottia gigantea]|uniref:Kinetochore protein SPC25 n=1 Tax=Lottia gigantea TaxID=225164 RepID=V3ZDI6_LOTGI|nr:hypothetical protein LOTGIDRAFT_237170 [Lottia gigantea]ESO82097.1 hypothetical protein LOTGIDRAFT_237170 [Lottia gigantea]